MSSIMTKWSVYEKHDVTVNDVANGLITDAAVDRWVAIARSAYLDQCPKVEAFRAGSRLVVKDRSGPHGGGSALGSAASVVVSASATEVKPTSFTLSVRVRPLGANLDRPLNTTCVIRLEDPTTGVPAEINNDIRDELIALEHAARHSN